MALISIANPTVDSRRSPDSVLPATNWSVLAFVRFLLAGIVFAEHAQYVVQGFNPFRVIGLPVPFDAIIGFLLISGLSIGHSLLRDKANYYRRRVERIYPVYIVSMVLVFVLDPVVMTPQVGWQIVLNLLFLNQLVTNFSLIPPAWTLSLEVWLYTLAPLLLRLSYRSLLIICYVSLTAYTFFVFGRTVFGFPYFSGTMYGINLLVLTFFWLLGFMIAVFPEKISALSAHVAGILAFHLCLNTLIQVGSQIRRGTFGQHWLENGAILMAETVILLGVYLVIFNRIRFRPLSSKARQLMVIAGNISYPFYLTHYTLLTFLREKGITNWFVVSVSCVVLAAIVYWLFDVYARKRETLVQKQRTWRG